MFPKEYYDAMIKNDIGRLDLDGICPYDGEDDEGRLKYPSDIALRQWFDAKAKAVPWSDELMFAGRPWEYMKPIINLLMNIEKMMQFLVEAGFTPDRLQSLIPMNKMKGSNEEKPQMRNVMSNFFSRVLKGTFPEKKHYTYFRNDDEGFEDVIHFTPIVVYLIHREKQRSEELLITARQSGITLPADYQAKIDFTMAYAASEAARGKTYQITNMARNLEESVMRAAIDDVGDTEAARRGMAASAKAASAPPGGEHQRREGEDEDEGDLQNQAKKRRIEVRNLSDSATSAGFCLVCGGGRRQIEQCQQPGVTQTAVALNLIQSNLEEGSKSPASDRATSKATRGRKDKLPKTSMPRKKRWNRATEATRTETESCAYSKPTHRSDLGDRAEGGEKLVNEVDIAEGGPPDMTEMELVIERASAEALPIAQ
eukprot:s3204_g10.t1